MTSTDKGVEALLLPGVGSTTCGSLTAMALLKVKAWVLGSGRCSVQTPSISAGAPRVDWPSILTSALPITSTESGVEALLLPSTGSTTCGEVMAMAWWQGK